PHTCGGKIGRNCGSGPTTGPAGITVQRVRIEGLPKERTGRGDVQGILVHIRLSDNDGTCIEQSLYQRSVIRWDPTGERERTRGRLHVGRVVIVLDDDWDAKQQAAAAASSSYCIARICFGECVLIDDANCVER